LKTSIQTLCCFLTLLFSCETQTPRQDAQKEKMPSNNIRNYLIRQATEITESALKNIEGKEDWQEIRDSRYNEMVQMLSLKDIPLQGQRSPLNVKKTGTIQMDGYRIEKLYYESLPGLYVPANLYIPDNITEPRPAILYQCGHARSQKVHYQPHPHRYAQLGFVCLIVETVQYGEVFGEHWGCYANGWFNWYSRGYTPAGVETWNGIRGLDLLSEMPEVDPEKLGVTGISGGGALTWYIAAIDPRIKAAATVCGNSTMEAQICTRTIDGHCDCMMFTNTYGRDFHDLGALIAPRPLFIAQADRDGLNTIESATEVYESLKKFYGLFGAEENIDFISTPGGHSYHPNSRKAIFSFFIQHLMNKIIPPEDIADVPTEALLSEADLRVYVDGPPADDITTTIQDSFIQKPVPPDFTSISELEVYRDEIIELLKEKSFQAFPEHTTPFGEKMEFRTLDRAAFGSEIFGFNTEADWRLKLDIRYRSQRNGKKPLMIVLRNPDEQRWDSEAFISGLNDDWNVAYMELRGIGETGWAPELQWHVRRAAAWTGLTIASMRVYDLLRTIEFARGLPDVDAGQIGIAARGEMASIALYAALLDGNCKTLILQNPPPTQDVAGNPDGRGDALEMLNCLQITDVYQLPALVHPTQTWFVGDVPDSYQWSLNTMKKLNLNAQIVIVEDLTAIR
jgi:cephalosporin-C deacetylase-like acetyl esterase